MVRMRGITLLLLGLFVGLSGWLAAQEEKEEPQPPAKKNVPMEKEANPPTKLKEVPIDDDPIPKVVPKDRPKQPTIAPVPEDAAAVNLAVEAGRVKHPIARDLLLRMSVPYDSLLDFNGRTTRIQPIERPWVEIAGGGGELAVSFLNGGAERTLQVNQIKSIRSFEEIAVTEVNGFLRRKLESPESPLVAALPRKDQLEVAEKVLIFARRFHLSALEQRRRSGDGWKGTYNQLNTKLLEVQREQLRSLIQAKKWDNAGHMAMQMGLEHPDEPDVQQEVYRILMLQTESKLKNDSDAAYIELRESVALFERMFPGTKDDVVMSMRARLRARAEEIVRQAQALAREGKQSDAMTRLRSAEAIDPELPELDRVRSTLKIRYPILYVGMRSLPENISPLLARSDADLRGMELVYESLLQALPDLQLGRRYKPVLSRHLPMLSPLSREFQLVSNARWPLNDGKEAIDALDVRGTLQMMQEFPDRWASENLDMLQVGEVNKTFAVQMKMRQGYLDPLALMTFKILPAKWMKSKGWNADSLEYARNPIGSGPFYLVGSDAKDARSSVIFRANPLYGQRPGKLGLPNIREIHFVPITEYSQAVQDLKAGKLHLLLDVPTEKIKDLTPLVEADGNAAVHTFSTNRRIHMLAVNHRRPALQSAELRRGIAHALQRNEILNTSFRGGDTASKFHNVLTGPFPPGTWATPERAGDLYREQLASTFLSNRASQGGVELRLLYPNHEPAIAQACAQIKVAVEQLSKVAGSNQSITIRLDGRSPSEVRRLVEIDHDFDLAYTEFDYRDDLFQLGGLLDPQAARSHGRNYMGYLLDGTGADQTDRRIQQLLQETRTHRDFRNDLREKYHELHRLFLERMPFIPLWQVDRHMIRHKRLTIVFQDTQNPELPRLLDPVTIFTQAQEWKLEE